MKILKNILVGLVLLIILMAIIGLVALPQKSMIERSLVIQAPAEVIFDQVNDLKKNVAWSPWKDPTMQITYENITAGNGAQSHWTSKKMGNGTMTITESVPSSSIKIDLDFGNMGTAKSVWTFASETEGVKVTEQMFSDAGMNPVKRWMSLLSNKMVGGYFEQGLASLKEVSMTRAGEMEAEQKAAQAEIAAAEALRAKAMADSIAAEAAKPKAKGKHK